jgi:hypothetical protein
VAKPPEHITLLLGRLGKGFRCLTPQSGRRLAYAAAICLEDRKQRRGVKLEVRGDRNASFKLSWPRTTEQVRLEWSDPLEATENGACGIAILLISSLTDYHIVQRSWKGTGFDYWLELKDDIMFQHAARLEVSGIRRGDTGQVEARVRQKMKQTEQSKDLRIPAFVVVVEFGTPVAVVVKL